MSYYDSYITVYGYGSCTAMQASKQEAKTKSLVQRKPKPSLWCSVDQGWLQFFNSKQ
jgi:hypothetical protein